MSTKNLSILTIFLFVVSLVVHFNESHRNSSLVTGSYFIKGLDLNKIQKIIVKFDDKNKISLLKDQNKFVLNSHKSYPADTAKVNDLIYQIASLQVKEKVGSSFSNDQLKELKLTDDSKKYEIEIFDTEGNLTQAFFVGKKLKNKGHYLLKKGKDEVYLSDGSLWINSSYKNFISRVLLNVEKEAVDKVMIQAQESLEIARNDNDFNVVSPKIEAKPKKINSYVTGLSDTWFEDYFQYGDDEVKNLKFDQSLRIKLKNKLTFDLKIAKKEDDFFVKASASAAEVPNKLVIDQSAGVNDIARVGDMIGAKQQADAFNLEKGEWIYKLSESNYEKLIKKSKDLM